MYEKLENKLLTAEMIGNACGEAASLYFRRNDMYGAMDLVKRGMKYDPFSEILHRKKKSIEEYWSNYGKK